MNQEKAKRMAQAIISEVRKQIKQQKARVRTGVVPDLDHLTKAIQTYAIARYVTHPEVWPKRRRCVYTRVVVDWHDEEWQVWLHRVSTCQTLPLTQKVAPLPDRDCLFRRTGEIEVVEGEMHLRRDPATGVYLTEGYRPPQEILQAALAGPFRVEVRQTAITFYRWELPMVLRYEDPDEWVDLCYRQQQARITPGSGELLSHLAMWRMME
jgi:hypothetical protein